MLWTPCQVWEYVEMRPSIGDRFAVASMTTDDGLSATVQVLIETPEDGIAMQMASAEARRRLWNLDVRRSARDFLPSVFTDRQDIKRWMPDISTRTLHVLWADLQVRTSDDLLRLSVPQRYIRNWGRIGRKELERLLSDLRARYDVE